MRITSVNRFIRFASGALVLGVMLAASACGDPSPDSHTFDDSLSTAPTSDVSYADMSDTTSGSWWRAAPGTRWQWQLTGVLDTQLDVNMVDVDLMEVSGAELESLLAKNIVVICYFSAGSYEDWRPDAKDFPAEALGKTLDGWPDEKWVDIRHDGIRDIVRKRLDLAVERGCDGVEPDNVDAYVNPSGFPLTAADQLDFNRFVADQAHLRGLSVGLKNDPEQVVALEPKFDWVLVESCLEYDECDAYLPFLQSGKAVFHVEYLPEADASTVCAAAKKLGFDTLIKNLDLDAWKIDCATY